MILLIPFFFLTAATLYDIKYKIMPSWTVHGFIFSSGLFSWIYNLGWDLENIFIILCLNGFLTYFAKWGDGDSLLLLGLGFWVVSFNQLFLFFVYFTIYTFLFWILNCVYYNKSLLDNKVTFPFAPVFLFTYIHLLII